MKPSFSRTVLGIAGATLVLMLFDVAAAGFHFGVPHWRSVAAHLLTASVLAYAVWAARSPGIRIFAGALLLYYVVTYVNTMDEGVFFLGFQQTWVTGALVGGLIMSALVSGALVLLMGKWGKGQPSGISPQSSASVSAATGFAPNSFAGWMWRLAVGAFAYLVLYFVAGLCVVPFTKDFYAQFPLPSPGSIVLMEIFRGLLYIGAAIPILRMIGARRPGAFALGLAFSVLGGIAPLLPDNPVMPPNIRFAHTIEIGLSNFIFGVIVAYLFVRRPAAAPAQAELSRAA